jgi:hypothetical protein
MEQIAVRYVSSMFPVNALPPPESTDHVDLSDGCERSTTSASELAFSSFQMLVTSKPSFFGKNVWLIRHSF